MPHPRRAILPEEWPEPDQLLWDKAKEDADPLYEPGGAAHWKPKTRQTVMVHYGLWLAWLIEMGLLDPAVPPAARATRDHLAQYVQHLGARDCAPVTIAGCIRDLREAIRVMEPDADLTVISDLLVRLNSAAEPSRNKRLRVVSSGLLYEAAIREMKRLHRRHPVSDIRQHAARFRDALIIAVLALRPIRLENLTAIELGRHLTKIGDRHWCRFAPTEMKEDRPLEFRMPEALTSWLDHYIAIYRPLLLRNRQTSPLWISIRSTPMKDNSIYYRVTACTERLIGSPINPHLFRDCAATTIATFAPEDIGIISRILGHSNLATAERSYNQAGMLSAGRRWHQALEKFRGTSGVGVQDPYE
jgi:integrase/recombinase XerD